ncbi:MAG: hypothetical protein KAT32_03260 [Candidatus Moranbacteria bacterium]|nr:hypothetical protein [Candidatus Moranbacteria bacterium]
MSRHIKEPEYNYDSQFESNFVSSEGCLSKNTIFCFKHIDKDYDADKLCNKKTENNLKKAFIKKIQQISKIEIALVQSNDRTGFGYELLNTNQLKKDIPNSVTQDIEKVHVFRFGGKGRIVGYYNENIFHILFIDPHLELYNHGS